jgi:DNA-binding transcriptional LysR family regulator
MEFRQIEHFLAVVEEQQFTRAARRNGLSQSALSASIRALEHELDAKLFRRTSRGVDLTESGQALLETAPQILRAVAVAQDDVAASVNRLAGSLHVGGVQTLGILDQSQPLADFHAQHPEVEITYRAGITAELIPDVASGHLDFAFVSVPTTERPGVEIEKLASFPLVFVCRPDHPLAGRDVIDLNMLGEETFVGGPPNTVLDSMFGYVARASGAKKKVSLHADDADSARAFTEKGLGVTLMPRAFVKPPLVAVPLSDERLVWNIGVATAPPEVRRRAATILLEMVRALAVAR